MATVQDLLDLLNDKLLPYRAAYAIRGADDVAAIRALDQGKENVWRVVVAASQKSAGNWFAKSGSLSYTAGVNVKDLPADFHSLLSAESTTVRMRPSGFGKEDWRDDREETGNADLTTLEALYYVVGGNVAGTPALLVSRKPAATLTVDIQYTASLAKWSVVADNIDVLPAPLRDPVATWAAQSLLGAAQDEIMARFWSSLCEVDRTLVAAISEGRQFGGVVTAEDFDSAG